MVSPLPSRPVFLVLGLLALALSLHTGWGLYSQAHGGLDSGGRPLFTDYIAFWSAGRLALQGTAAAAYDLSQMMFVQQTALAGLDIKMPYHYPPIFLLLLAPLALLPYVVAAATFQLATLGGLLLVLWQRLDATGRLLLFASPALFYCAIQGQNGFLSAALLTTGLLQIERRPVWSGLCFGLLCFKPHFVVLLPLLLLAGGYWRVLMAQGITVLLLLLASIVAFGFESWLAFLHNASFASTLLAEQEHKWFKMGSAFVSARMLGADNLLAGAIHFGITLAGLLCVAPLWRKRNLVAMWLATPLLVLLASPFQFDYDLPLILPALLLWRLHTQNRYSLTLIGLLWACPYLSLALASLYGIGILPVLLLLALWRLKQEAPTWQCPAQCDTKQTP